jgi:hypothetical protein
VDLVGGATAGTQATIYSSTSIISDVSKTSQTVWKRSGAWHLTLSDLEEQSPFFGRPYDKWPAARECEVTAGSRPVPLQKSGRAA